MDFCAQKRRKNMKNKVNLIGRLGKDPEIAFAPNGTAVVKFSLATWYTTKSGEKITTWHNIVAFKKTAENIAQHLKKGAMVDIEGMTRNGSYDTIEGEKRYFHEVVVRTIIFLPSKKSDQSSSPNDQLENNHDQDYMHGDTPPDDDIPF